MSVRPGEIDFEKIKEKFDMKEDEMDMQVEQFTPSSVGSGIFNNQQFRNFIFDYLSIKTNLAKPFAGSQQVMFSY
jgi:hypothetical protein